MKKIVIIEDDLGISASLKLYLENSDFNVITHNTGDKAPEFIISETPDLVILDINLPVMDGIEVCSEVRKHSEVPIIMLTARTGEMDRVTGLESGADDYIAKPFSPRELLARINSILRRSSSDDAISDSKIISHENVSINRETMELFVDKVSVSITKNEFDILEKIFIEDGKLVSRETLMTEVIGYDNYVYDRTIDTHIKNLRKKLKNKDMIVTIRAKGYRLNK
ncbi:response regulator transcription factor [Candidatus Gracilibacteria bacterium]|nr:response regulator transcription factor [Candidatus Gracilibacteria bacterium]